MIIDVEIPVVLREDQINSGKAFEDLLQEEVDCFLKTADSVRAKAFTSFGATKEDDVPSLRFICSESEVEELCEAIRDEVSLRGMTPRRFQILEAAE